MDLYLIDSKRFSMIAKFAFSFLAGVFVLFSGTGPSMALQPRGCLSGSCHLNLTQTRYLHGPVAAEMAGGKGCVICHEPAGAKCTATKGGVFKLRSKALCLTCHDKGTSTTHSQEQVESKCPICHDPHGSEFSPQLLKAAQKR